MAAQTRLEKRQLGHDIATARAFSSKYRSPMPPPGLSNHRLRKRPTYRELGVSHRRDYRAARRRLAEAALEKPDSTEPNIVAPGPPWSIDQHGCLTRTVGG